MERPTPTYEQSAILRTEFRRGDLSRLQAFAGGSKTTLLAMLSDTMARRYPAWTQNYFVFNREMKDSAKKMFSSKVKVSTVHSLAFKAVGNRYLGKLSKEDIKEVHIVKALNLPEDMAGWLLARYILATLKAFMSSADHGIMEIHIPRIMDNDKEFVTIEDVLEKARGIWAMMIDKDDARIHMVHDAYLKLFQISGPKITADVIFMDESQDITPCMLDIVIAQTGALRIFVGDEYQQIYSWRGAINAMGAIQPTHDFKLTVSFRFNQAIANVANYILRNHLGESTPIIGVGPQGKVGPLNTSEKFAVLSRTRASLFDNAVANLGHRRMYFAGGVDTYGFDLIKQVFYLYSGQHEKIHDRLISKYPDYTELEKYVDVVDDMELRVICHLVEAYGGNIPMLVDRIQHEALHNSEQADIILSTAHKAKGLGFDNVLVSDDFLRGETVAEQAANLKQEDANLLYVAVTRARRGLCIPHGLEVMLSEDGVDYHTNQPSFPPEIFDSTFNWNDYSMDLDTFLGCR